MTIEDFIRTQFPEGAFVIAQIASEDDAEIYRALGWPCKIGDALVCDDNFGQVWRPAGDTWERVVLAD